MVKINCTGDFKFQLGREKVVFAQWGPVSLSYTETEEKVEVRVAGSVQKFFVSLLNK